MFRASQFPADTDHFVPCFTVHCISLYRALRLFACSGRLDPELEKVDLNSAAPYHDRAEAVAFLSSLNLGPI